MKTVVILSASSLTLVVTGLVIMFSLPMATNKINHEIQQFVTDKEYIHDVYGQYIRLRAAYPPIESFPNPFGIGLIAAGVVLFLVALIYYERKI